MRRLVQLIVCIALVVLTIAWMREPAILQGLPNGWQYKCMYLQTYPQAVETCGMEDWYVVRVLLLPFVYVAAAFTCQLLEPYRVSYYVS